MIVCSLVSMWFFFSFFFLLEPTLRDLRGILILLCFSAPQSDREKLTVTYALDYWIDNGFPAYKIALGLATYGRTFRLKNANDHGLGAPTAEWGNPRRGTYTREPGFLAYYEICNYGYTIVEDNAAKAPYGYKGTDWVGFENVKSIVYKVKLLIKGLSSIILNSFAYVICYKKS